jgi:UDP-N-acetylglucosamine 4-epimerase
MAVYEELQKTLKSKPRTWLVTGAAGFIGSHLVECLLKLDQRVVGLDNFSTGYQHNLDDVKSLVSLEQWNRFQFINSDICNLKSCHEAMVWRGSSQEEKVEFVLHQAALGSVPRSIEDPIGTHRSNVDGFLNVLVAARDAKVKSFVYASSSAVYGDHPGLPKVEDQIGNPLSPYALTKRANELYADVFAKVYGFHCIGLRYFNVFGARQDPNGAYAAVIPKWIDALIRGETVFINGDGETSRDFCYVDNVVQANLLAAMTENPSAQNQVYNIAVGERTSLNRLYQVLVYNLAGSLRKKEAAPIYKGFRAGDVPHSLGNISNAREQLGYEPLTSLEQGIKIANDWYVKTYRNN